jgi:hypothetical protein
VDGGGAPAATINRRDLFRLTVAGGSGLALGKLLDVGAMREATRAFTLSDISEFMSTSCTTRITSSRTRTPST